MRERDGGREGGGREGERERRSRRHGIESLDGERAGGSGIERARVREERERGEEQGAREWERKGGGGG